MYESMITVQGPNGQYRGLSANFVGLDPNARNSLVLDSGGTWWCLESINGNWVWLKTKKIQFCRIIECTEYSFLVKEIDPVRMEKEAENMRERIERIESEIAKIQRVVDPVIEFLGAARETFLKEISRAKKFFGLKNQEEL